MIIRLTLIQILIQLIFIANAQKEANVWYFGHHAGLDFNNGQPLVLTDMFRIGRNCASISDSGGNFLFATEATMIFNREKQIMQNSYGLKGHHFATAGVLIVQKPGSDHLYYVFTVTRFDRPPGMYYSVVDMTLDNDLGAVTSEKNIPLDAAWDAVEKLFAVRHENGKDVWIITRKHEEDSYAGFLLTADGIVDEPVLSFSPGRLHHYMRGSMKASYNKKFFLSAYGGIGLAGFDPPERFDMNRFNPLTGEIEFMYSIRIKQDNSDANQAPNSVEFSPDSKLAYFCTWSSSFENENETERRIYQYDMSLVEDSAQFVESAILISHNGGSGIQLATDGKIYCGMNEHNNGSPSPVHVIHYPWKRGTACYFEENAIEFPEGYGARHRFRSCLYRMEFW